MTKNTDQNAAPALSKGPVDVYRSAIKEESTARAAIDDALKSHRRAVDLWHSAKRRLEVAEASVIAAAAAGELA